MVDNATHCNRTSKGIQTLTLSIYYHLHAGSKQEMAKRVKGLLEQVEKGKKPGITTDGLDAKKPRKVYTCRKCGEPKKGGCGGKCGVSNKATELVEEGNEEVQGS